jgi:hypothetical protein
MPAMPCFLLLSETKNPQITSRGRTYHNYHKACQTLR